MKFIVSVAAATSCAAKQKAKRKVSIWSHENNETVFIQNIRVANSAGNKIVTIIAKGDDRTIYL